MRLALCNHSSLWDLHDECVRTSWSAFVPVAFVAIICLSYIPPPRGLVGDALATIKGPFQVYITLPEAEALDVAHGKVADHTEDVVQDKSGAPVPLPLWRTVVLSWIALLEALIWLSLGSFFLITDTQNPWRGIQRILISLSWLYASARPVVHPAAAPPYDLFMLYIIHLATGMLLLGGVLYDTNVLGRSAPTRMALAGLVANIVAVLGLLGVVLKMPLAIPNRRAKEEDPGRIVPSEDYTSLFNWITFYWIYPLVKLGRYNTLNESDVSNLSPLLRSRPLFIKFLRTLDEYRTSTLSSYRAMASNNSLKLIWALWTANSLDLIAEIVLTLTSVLLTYASPLFLKLILEAIDNPSRENHSLAYIYAFLAFLVTLLKGQADLNHLYFGRRAAQRMRSELFAAIYEKALKRKDYSGIVDKEKEAEAKEARRRKSTSTSPSTSTSSANLNASTTSTAPAAEKKRDSEDDPRAGADVGKIVNLMAADTSKLVNLLLGIYYLYAAPFEIILASIFLYKILGLSAFAGFLVLLAGWPLNSFFSRRSIRIQKGLSTARDKRMAVLNELITAAKFIKFFAWENHWITRTLESRDAEIKWLVKSRLNSTMFYILWTAAPILVSIVSFLVYVLQGNELTIATAFTAIALFNMIRQPLNIIPMYLVQVLQTKVAVDRIATFLAEDEVTEQVSTLKKADSRPEVRDEEDGLGIESGFFRWNEVESAKDETTDTPAAGKFVPPPGNPDADADVAASETVSSNDDGSDVRFELKDINVMFPEGRMTVITGPTASGKTALLLALLGELTSLPGTRIIMCKDTSRIDRNGFMHAISYAAQMPWLKNQSIKDNILFGQPYDGARYHQVLECCALKPDLDILEDGDDTEIGPRGVTLSGGQKARVALARAVYARTKYVLLDDPLSAVDSHTSRFLFERLLCGPLLEDRTVVLVTHHVQLVLPAAYYIIRMLDGRIDTQGVVKELKTQGLLDEIQQDDFTQTRKEPSAQQESTELPSSSPADQQADDVKKPKKHVEDEHREVGAVKWSVYNTYLKASSYWTWAILVLLTTITQLLGVGEKLWIKTWGEAYGDNNALRVAVNYVFKSFATGETEFPVDDTIISHPLSIGFFSTRLRTLKTDWPNAMEHPLYYIGIYAAIGMATAAINVAGYVVQFTGALKASRVLFERLLRSVARATMRWYDVTPQGRLLNRFGKDIETIDTSLAGSLQSVNYSLATFFAAGITVAWFFPPFLVPAFVIGFLYRELTIGYMNTCRDLRRMESNSRSPIFSEFGELLEGIVTVRAFSAEPRFLDGMFDKIDFTTKMWYGYWMVNRWLLLNFDVLGATAVLVTTLFSVSGLVSAGIAGLCITSSLSFTMSIYWACRFWSALELDLNAVERVVEYLQLPQEPPSIMESHRPPAYWPSSSSNDDLLVVEDLVVKYSPELPPVLHGVSFRLKAKERVGLLGRTGSGKSTLAMSVLRFVEPAGGRIIIDGIDITTIGINDLRSRVTFIPQDATLFSGTLRQNLDPFEEHDDSECLDVLHRVHLITTSAYDSLRGSRDQSREPSIYGVERDDAASLVSASGTDLDAKVKISLDTQISPGGNNFSQGQRQLIAMARALLRRSSIIVLDEATSSIDFATDTKIQATIREEFGDSLLLTVAHRLRTVIDYDRLIILDKGQIAEFDTPFNLIQKEDGIFRSMCLNSGTFEELEAAARASSNL